MRCSSYCAHHTSVQEATFVGAEQTSTENLASIAWVAKNLSKNFIHRKSLWCHAIYNCHCEKNKNFGWGGHFLQKWHWQLESLELFANWAMMNVCTYNLSISDLIRKMFSNKGGWLPLSCGYNHKKMICPRVNRVLIKWWINYLLNERVYFHVASDTRQSSILHLN